MSSSSAGASAADLAVDSDNHFLWRMNSRRLESESVRDSIFYTAGNLDLTHGGPDFGFTLATTTPRRSIYFQHAYEKENKFLEVFDSASVDECYRRNESIVPQQALAMANSDLTVNESRMLTRKLSDVAAKSPDANRAFVRLAYEHVLSREPTMAELTECELFVRSQAEMFQHGAKLTVIAGGPKASVPAAGDPIQRARENLTLVLYNHNDFVTVH